MNWKIRLVLLFARLTKPIDGAQAVDIAALRRKSQRTAALGSRLFDRHVPVMRVTDTVADEVPLRIYQVSSDAQQRVMIYFHGGGFVLYSPDDHDNVCRRLAHMNRCIVVSVDYRLAPEYSFPSAHQDAFTSIQWVLTHIADYGGNPADLVVAGDSAGGNLAACMAHRCRTAAIPLRAQILIYPWIDGRLTNPSIQRNGHGYLLNYETMLWFQQQYTPRVEDQCVPAVSPCFEPDCSGLAPALILTASLDPLLDDGRLYYEQLTAAGTPARYREFPGLFHGFFNIPFIHPFALQAYDEVRDFLHTC